MKEKDFRTYLIKRSVSGQPMIGVGGTAFTDTTRGRVVYRANGNLPQAIPASDIGAVVCDDIDQAFVPLEVGDIIIDYHGKLPVSRTNIHFHTEAFICIDICRNSADGEEIHGIDVPLMPESVKRGLSAYHNTDGRFFVNGGQV